jgi:hypothetical protein
MVANSLEIEPGIIEMLAEAEVIEIEQDGIGRQFLLGLEGHQWEYVYSVLSIATYLVDLPDESLKAKATTSDLEKLWEDLQNISCWIAAYFVADRFSFEVPQNFRPLRKWDAQICEQLAFYYRAIWDLIQAGFKVIAQKFPEVEDTPLNLFQKILKEDREAVFLERANHYCLVDIRQRADFYEKQLEDPSLPSARKRAEIRQAKILRDPQVFKNSWLQKIIPILEKAAQRDYSIQSRLLALDTEYKSLAELLKNTYKARTAAGTVYKPEQWYRGKRIRLGTKLDTSK